MSCGRDAAASLQFDNSEAKVVIIDLADTFSGIPICRAHARTRTAPMGWTMDDRRSISQPSLWTGDAPSRPRQVPMIDQPAAVPALACPSRPDTR